MKKIQTLCSLCACCVLVVCLLACSHSIDANKIPWETYPDPDNPEKTYTVLAFCDIAYPKETYNLLELSKDNNTYNLLLTINDTDALAIEGEFTINEQDITLSFSSYVDYAQLNSDGTFTKYYAPKPGKLTATPSKDFKSITIKGTVTLANIDTGKTITVPVNHTIAHMPYYTMHR